MLYIITFGFYGLFWFYKIRDDIGVISDSIEKRSQSNLESVLKVVAAFLMLSSNGIISVFWCGCIIDKVEGGGIKYRLKYSIIYILSYLFLCMIDIRLMRSGYVIVNIIICTVMQKKLNEMIRNNN